MSRNPKSKRRGHCHVTGVLCKAPTAVFALSGPITQCKRCGKDVCTNCSKRVSIGGRQTYERVRRWCFDCLATERGEEAVTCELKKLEAKL